MSDLRAELIQVAAVAVAMIQDLDQGDTAMSMVAIATHRQVMFEVTRERFRQEAKWGPQHHPIEWWVAILGEEVGEACEDAREVEFEPGDEPIAWALVIDGADWGRRCKRALTDKFGGDK